MSDELAIITKDLKLISTNLAKSLHLDDVIYSFLEKELISLQIYDEFMKSNESSSSRSQSLVNFVAKNPHTISDFIQALMKEGLNEIAGHISPSAVDSFQPRVAANGMTAKELTFRPLSATSLPSPMLPHQPLGLPTSPTFPKVKENFVLNIKVKYSRIKYGAENNRSDIYKNTSNPRGFIFIANFESFDNNTYNQRMGSDIDVKNLQELFSQMGYTVVGPYINLTKYELIKAIVKFCERDDLAGVDSCVVAIMSHGKGDMAFLTSDNKVLNYLEILELFNNRACPSLFGKPKVFIFQSCRGAIADDGVGSVAQFGYPVSFTNETCTDAAFIGKTIPVTSSPSFTDMYIIHSSLEGFVSFRCPDRGSWLIETLCIEFMENACDKDLESLMRLVSGRLRLLYSDTGKKQICEIRNVGFDKLLYFNPISAPHLPESDDIDEADVPLGSASHYKAFRKMRENTKSEPPVPYKRQLSDCSDAEGLKLCNSLINFLQINDMSDMLVSAEEIKTEVQKKKIQHKRRKTEDDEDRPL